LGVDEDVKIKDPVFILVLNNREIPLKEIFAPLPCLSTNFYEVYTVLFPVFTTFLPNHLFFSLFEYVVPLYSTVFVLPEGLLWS